jgi:hypothetical protein
VKVARVVSSIANHTYHLAFLHMGAWFGRYV